MKEYTHEMCRLIGKALVNRRKQLGRTQAGSSKMCGRSVHTLSSIENGFYRSLNLDILSDVCVGYDCSAQDILHDARALIDPDMADAMRIVESSQRDESISLDFLDGTECFDIGEILGMLRMFSGKSTKFLSEAMNVSVSDIHAIEAGDYSSLSHDLIIKYIKACAFNDADFLRVLELAMLNDKLAQTLGEYFVKDSRKVSYVVEPMISLMVMVMNTVYRDGHDDEDMPREYLSCMLRRVLRYVDALDFDDIGSLFDSLDRVLPCESEDGSLDTGSVIDDSLTGDVLSDFVDDDEFYEVVEDNDCDVNISDNDIDTALEILELDDDDMDDPFADFAFDEDSDDLVPLKPYSVDLSQEN